MKSQDRGKAISFKDALHIFWDWRQAAISVEVCFFCRPGSSEDVRVSIDGVVRLVDPEGLVTVSGDGREMELDLRGCEITRAREAAPGAGVMKPLDPDSILQVKFPNGEVCLIFPYRRVGGSLRDLRRPETGQEWMQSKLLKAEDDSPRSSKVRAGFFSVTTLAKRGGKASKPRTGRTGPPIFPAAAILLAILVAGLALTPSSVPKLLIELGVRQKMSDPNALVWVIPQDGNYYCSGSVLHGREPGRSMKQGEALTRGYQPAAGNYCPGKETAGVDSVDSGDSGFGLYFETVRQGGQALFSGLQRLSRSWLPLT